MNMTKDNPSATEQSASLYDWWLNAIPGLFAGLAPRPETRQGAEAPGRAAAAAQAEAAATAEDSTTPYPVDQIIRSLQHTQEMLAPLYRSYAQALGAPMSPAWWLAGLPSTGESPTRQFIDMLGSFGQAMAVPLKLPGGGFDAWSNLLARDGEVLGSLMTGAERTFGALADALGLAPSRELRDAWRTMEDAALAKQQAQLEYLAVIARVWAKGIEGLLGRLTEMGTRGESVDSVQELIRLWARITDSAAHDAMQSDEGLQASAKMIRAATRYRRAAHRVVAISSEAMNIPTRAEVDEAYREIQELKRELRRLKRSMAPPVAARRSATHGKDGRK